MTALFENKNLGIGSAVLTFFSVLAFAVCMVFGADNGSFISSLFISWGFVALICAYAVYSPKEKRAAAFLAVSFAIIYAVLIALVYFAQLTAVRMSELSEQAALLLDYSKFGLFFSYDLLGYAFMSLATFFTAQTLELKDRADKWLKGLLAVHGVFAITCFIMPMLGLFTPDMAGGDLIGTLVLEFWCLYFMPVCILSYQYFKRK